MPGGRNRQQGTAAVYGALVGPGANFAGPDQGIDFTGAFDVFAPVAGTISRVMQGGSGWSGDGALIVETLDRPGPHGERAIYYAEDLTPGVQVGAHVVAGQTIAHATGSGHAPGIEVGFADTAGHALAPLYPNPHSPKPEGLAFQSWVIGLAHSSGPDPGTIAGAINGGARHVPGVAQVEGAVGDTFGAIDSVGKALGVVFSARGLEVFAGFLLVVVGVVWLAKRTSGPTTLAGAAAALA